ncbi:MAG TPA: hypothetical protein VHV27_09730 [Phenylobacterium sp.]|jgi:hypothetical protein|nr:hypothetical protein [Phenylobacterium sp.]
MTDDATRILALEARLDDAQKVLMAHDLLLRGLLAELALAQPLAFDQLALSLAKLRMFREGGGGGELPREVAEEIAALLGEISRSVARRR